jgi:hypothetical protein
MSLTAEKHVLGLSGRRDSAALAVYIVLFAAWTISARAESWFRAGPEFVRRYSQELADKSLPTQQRLEAISDLRVLLTTFGAYNFDPALRTLKKIRREGGELGGAAELLLMELRTALKQPDKRLPNAPVVTGPR